MKINWERIIENLKSMTNEYELVRITVMLVQTKTKLIEYYIWEYDEEIT